MLIDPTRDHWMPYMMIAALAPPLRAKMLVSERTVHRQLQSLRSLKAAHGVRSTLRLVHRQRLQHQQVVTQASQRRRTDHLGATNLTLTSSINTSHLSSHHQDRIHSTSTATVIKFITSVQHTLRPQARQGLPQILPHLLHTRLRRRRLRRINQLRPMSDSNSQRTQAGLHRTHNIQCTHRHLHRTPTPTASLTLIKTRCTHRHLNQRIRHQDIQRILSTITCNRLHQYRRFSSNGIP